MAAAFEGLLSEFPAVNRIIYYPELQFLPGTSCVLCMSIFSGEIKAWVVLFKYIPWFHKPLE